MQHRQMGGTLGWVVCLEWIGGNGEDAIHGTNENNRWGPTGNVQKGGICCLGGSAATFSSRQFITLIQYGAYIRSYRCCINVRWNPFPNGRKLQLHDFQDFLMSSVGCKPHDFVPSSLSSFCVLLGPMSVGFVTSSGSNCYQLRKILQQTLVCLGTLGIKL